MTCDDLEEALKVLDVLRYDAACRGEQRAANILNKVFEDLFVRLSVQALVSPTADLAAYEATPSGELRVDVLGPR